MRAQTRTHEQSVSTKAPINRDVRSVGLTRGSAYDVTSEDFPFRKFFLREHPLPTPHRTPKIRIQYKPTRAGLESSVYARRSEHSNPRLPPQVATEILRSTGAPGDRTPEDTQPTRCSSAANFRSYPSGFALHVCIGCSRDRASRVSHAQRGAPRRVVM